MPVTSTSRTTSLAVVVLLALVAAACGGDDSDDAATTTTVTTPEGETAAPLTGLPLTDDSVLERPAMMVKIDNGPRALGMQRGLADADVVYTERVEGGATRLAAIFHSAGPVEVGPVRSARTSDLDLLANLNHPIFVFSGGNGGVLRQVAEADVDDIYYDRSPGLFLERGTGDLRLVIETETIYDEASDEVGLPPALFSYRSEGAAPVVGEEVERASVDYGGPVGTEVAYEPDRDGWARHQGGEPHVDASGEQVTATNVVFQFVEYTDSGFVDTTGAASPVAEVIGEGEAWVLTGGQLVRGRWSRRSESSETLFTDESGRPIDLEPGRTWIELAPVDSGTVDPAPAG